MWSGGSGPRCSATSARRSRDAHAVEFLVAHRTRQIRLSRRDVCATLSPMRPPFPDWLVPMAATLTQDRFVGPEWSFERKYDGIRLISFKRGADVQLFSRNHLPQHLPAIASSIAALPADQPILDGELDWDTSEYHVFDLLWRDDRDLRGLALDERRAELDTLPLTAPLSRVVPLDDDVPWERARVDRWE